MALASDRFTHPEFPDAAVLGPVLVRLDARAPADRERLFRAHPGPVFFVVAVDSAAAGADLMGEIAHRSGALTAGAYTTSDDVTALVTESAADAGVPLALNLTAGWYLTQSAVYCDLYGTRANPAANTVFCDGDYLTDRFRTARVSRPSTPPLRP